MEKTVEKELSVFSATVDVRIQDFWSANKVFSEVRNKKYQHLDILFEATVSCVDEDCLSVRVYVTINDITIFCNVSDLKWSVSIIDQAGNSKFTRYCASPEQPNLDYEKNELTLSQSEDSCCAKDYIYLRKAFILERADELLIDGAILLRCEIYFDFKIIKDLLSEHYDEFNLYMLSIPQIVCHKHSAETGDSHTVFDYTSQVLTLPQFDDLRKRFGVYGISPVSASISKYFEPKVEATHILKYVWIFDTCSDRFLLSLNPFTSRNEGHLLIKASPVIRRCVRAPMKEQREQRVEFPEVDSRTFQIVLYFLKSGEIKDSPSPDIEEVYKFSHLYEMENLQQNCAQYLSRICENATAFKRIEKMANLYSDEYLSLLLQKKLPEILESPDACVIHDKPVTDNYMI